MQAVNNISESVKSNSNKAIKFVRLQKLVKPINVEQALVWEMAKTSTVAFMKAKKYLLVWWREKCFN